MKGATKAVTAAKSKKEKFRNNSLISFVLLKETFAPRPVRGWAGGFDLTPHRETLVYASD